MKTPIPVRSLGWDPRSFYTWLRLKEAFSSAFSPSARSTGALSPPARYDRFMGAVDNFAKIDGRWFFAERKLILDWSETRSMTAPATG